MTRYLDLELALVVAARAIGGVPVLADPGLLESALARPQASVFGADAYPTLHLKAAALLHSLVKNHCLVDGNKRLAWLGTLTFLYVNGRDVHAGDDESYAFVIAVSDGTLTDLQEIADQLEAWSTPVR
ncbi:MAG: type II toxin-antitoxin system death-on-curing family toxin [Dermatophilaceae bacterium]